MLFAIYLDDLQEFLSKKFNGLDYLSDVSKELLSDDDVEVFFKLYILLYADDTIILAESPSDLQKALNGMYIYCSDWNLSVNASKTKVVIFSKGKIRNKPDFLYN